MSRMGLPSIEDGPPQPPSPSRNRETVREKVRYIEPLKIVVGFHALELGQAAQHRQHQPPLWAGGSNRRRGALR